MGGSHFDADGTLAAGSKESGSILLSLADFREVTSAGDVGNLAAHGGILASDSTPILRGETNENNVIVWASSNNDIIAVQVSLPADFDGGSNVSVRCRTSSGGTTDLASLVVETGWDGAALVSDTATGVATTTEGNAIATVAAADVPATPENLTLIITPAAHTTDTMLLHSVRIDYTKL